MKISKTVQNFLDKHKINYEIKDGNIYIPGNLYLSSLTSIPEGFNPTVGGNLDLRRLTSIPEGFNPTVGGDLDLSSLTSIPEGFNPTVGGDLYLSSLTSIPEGFNPTVGGDLDLRRLTSKQKKSIQINKPTYNIPQDIRTKIEPLLTWQDGKYRKIDDIFCEILTRKNNILKVKTRNKIAYIFTKNGIHAHGKTVKQAYLDWLFKTSDRDVSKYKDLDTEEIHDLNFWVIAYRTITGACSFGTNEYLEQNKDKYKDKMTLKEVLKATENQYGHTTFKEFFLPKK